MLMPAALSWGSASTGEPNTQSWMGSISAATGVLAESGGLPVTTQGNGSSRNSSTPTCTLLVGGVDEAGNVYVTDCNCLYNEDKGPYNNPPGALWKIVAADQVPAGAETAPKK